MLFRNLANYQDVCRFGARYRAGKGLTIAKKDFLSPDGASYTLSIITIEFARLHA